MTQPLDVFGDLTTECAILAKASPELSYALEVIGKPVVRRRPGGFAGLFRIIIEQQVSVPSAQAILKRIKIALDMNDTGEVMSLGVEGLRGLGLSRPKAHYVCGLAERIEHGELDLTRLPQFDDAKASLELQTIKGVGPWTAAIYLLFCEGRGDIWPPSDVALKGAFNRARADHASWSGKTTHRGKSLTQKELDAMARSWTPLRGVAAHILWTYYAHMRNRAPI
ncbi:MAG: DNA-3-methyladenine glycosylase 2 family protein [Pseudomonadota bacterium]